MTGRLLSTMLVLGVCATAARGDRVVEDFEHPLNGFNNPVFNHRIDIDEIAGAPPVFEFTEDQSVSPTHSLFLSPGADYITFNLPEGQYVDYAEAWIAGEPLLPAFFHVIGLDEAGDPLEVWHQAPDVSPLVFVSTADDGFSRITEIRLTAMKFGTFDDVAINVVPEPATMALLAMGLAGVVGLRTRRRR